MTRTERQAHGFIFQGWVFRKFLKLAYSGEWDIPAKINPLTHKSVSIKTAQWKSGIGLGDILIQYDINEDFEMLVAFYEKKGNKKKVVSMHLVEISIDKWRQLWGNIRKEDLIKFDTLVRSEAGRNLKGKKLDDFRANIQKTKNELFKDYNGKFSINPKIDSDNQRRVQCGLGFKDFFETFNLKCDKISEYDLWGEKIKLSSICLD